MMSLLLGGRQASSAGSRSRPPGQSADSPLGTLPAPFSDLSLRDLMARNRIKMPSLKDNSHVSPHYAEGQGPRGISKEA